MDKEFKDRVVEMLNSEDLEMITLGISLLINNATIQECQEIIPWSGNIILFGNEPFYIGGSHSSGLSNYKFPNAYPTNHIFIKDNIAVAFWGGKLICRQLGVMRCHCNFDKTDKTIF